MTQSTDAIVGTADGELLLVDPTSVITERNIRLDDSADADLVNSVKQRGILQPVIAVRNTDGNLVIKIGHRRTAAAIKAKKPLKVLVVASEADADAAEIDRIIDQHAENTHRAGLTTREEVLVVQQLLAMNVKPSEITKQTRIPKSHVEAARLVGASPAATEAMETAPELDMIQLAALSEFNEEPEIARRLVGAVKNGRFDHELEIARRDAASRAEKRELVSRLLSDGVTVLDDASYQHYLKNLIAPDVPDEDRYDAPRLDPDEHRACPGHAVVVEREWVAPQHTGPDPDDDEETGDDQADTDVDDPALDQDDSDQDEDNEWEFEQGGYRWLAMPVCTDPAANGHKSIYQSANTALVNGAGKTQEELAEEKSAERKRVLAGNKHWRAATKVRQAWLTELFKAKTLKSMPPHVIRIVAKAMLGTHYDFGHSMQTGHKTAIVLLGLAADADKVYGNKDRITELIDKATDARTQVIALALVLSAYEEHLSTETWRGGSDGTRGGYYYGHVTGSSAFLASLAEFGYTPSEIEQGVIEGRKYNPFADPGQRLAPVRADTVDEDSSDASDETPDASDEVTEDEVAQVSDPDDSGESAITDLGVTHETLCWADPDDCPNGPGPHTYDPEGLGGQPPCCEPATIAVEDRDPAYPVETLGDPFPGRDGYVTGFCGRAVAGSEWRAGFRNCEHCGQRGREVHTDGQEAIGPDGELTVDQLTEMAAADPDMPGVELHLKRDPDPTG